jgi:hypothetical protein
MEYLKRIRVCSIEVGEWKPDIYGLPLLAIVVLVVSTMMIANKSPSNAHFDSIVIFCVREGKDIWTIVFVFFCCPWC